MAKKPTVKKAAAKKPAAKKAAATTNNNLYYMQTTKKGLEPFMNEALEAAQALGKEKTLHKIAIKNYAQQFEASNNFTECLTLTGKAVNTIEFIDSLPSSN